MKNKLPIIAGFTTFLLTSGCGHLPVTRNQLEEQTKQIYRDIKSTNAKQTKYRVAHSEKLTKLETDVIYLDQANTNQAVSILKNRENAGHAANERRLLEQKIKTLEDLHKRNPEKDINGTYSEDMWYNSQKLQGVRVFFGICENGKQIDHYEITRFGKRGKIILMIEPDEFNQMVRKAKKNYKPLVESLQKYNPKQQYPEFESMI